jgi:hypothetical protein
MQTDPGQSTNNKPPQKLTRQQWLRTLHNLSMIVAFISMWIGFFSGLSRGLVSAAGNGIIGWFVGYLILPIIVLPIASIRWFISTSFAFLQRHSESKVLELIGNGVVVIGFVLFQLVVWRYLVPFAVGLAVGALVTSFGLRFGLPEDVLLKNWLSLGIEFASNPEFQERGMQAGIVLWTIGGIILAIVYGLDWVYVRAEARAQAFTQAHPSFWTGTITLFQGTGIILLMMLMVLPATCIVLGYLWFAYPSLISNFPLYLCGCTLVLGLLFGFVMTVVGARNK